jgi:hypothetical protein
MLIALIVLLLGVPLYLFIAPVKKLRLASLPESAQPEPAALVPVSASEPEQRAFELPLRGEAHRHG